MGDGYDRFEGEGGGGGSFVIGLLTGTVLGAGLGMLFAPKAGSELRSQLSEQAGKAKNTASEGYRRAAETANDLAGKGRDLYGRAREAMSRGAEEADRYVRDTTSGIQGSGPGRS
jgi:gas vesicle protein